MLSEVPNPMKGTLKELSQKGWASRFCLCSLWYSTWRCRSCTEYHLASCNTEQVRCTNIFISTNLLINNINKLPCPLFISYRCTLSSILPGAHEPCEAAPLRGAHALLILLMSILSHHLANLPQFQTELYALTPSLVQERLCTFWRLYVHLGNAPNKYHPWHDAEYQALSPPLPKQKQQSKRSKENVVWVKDDWYEKE